MTQSKKPVPPKSIETIAHSYYVGDECGDRYLDDITQEGFYPWLLALLQGSSQILAMGFGQGNISHLLCDHGITHDLVEGSELLCQQARAQHGSQIRCYHERFEAFVPPHRYDTIVCTFVLEHVDDPVLVMKRTRDWLVPGGRLLVSVPNAESIHRRLAVLMKLQPATTSLSDRDRFVGHQRVYTVEAFCRDAMAAGFGVVAAQGFQLKILPYSMMMGFSLELLRAMNAISDQFSMEMLANIGFVLKESD